MFQPGDRVCITGGDRFSRRGSAAILTVAPLPSSETYTCLCEDPSEALSQVNKAEFLFVETRHLMLVAPSPYGASAPFRAQARFQEVFGGHFMHFCKLNFPRKHEPSLFLSVT